MFTKQDYMSCILYTYIVYWCCSLYTCQSHANTFNDNSYRIVIIVIQCTY